MNNDLQTNENNCSMSGFGTKLMFLAIGGGIGATIALLFAPKPGRELRADIADKAGDVYGDAVEAGHLIKERSAEFYRNAKETGAEVSDIIAGTVSAVAKEVKEDAVKIGGMLEEGAEKVMDRSTALM
jgi:gas vesicle protein